MATYTSFLDILPDPTNPIGSGGQALATSSGGINGPGFASVNFGSSAPIQMSRTNSGRVVKTKSFLCKITKPSNFKKCCFCFCKSNNYYSYYWSSWFRFYTTSRTQYNRSNSTTTRRYVYNYRYQ